MMSPLFLTYCFAYSLRQGYSYHPEIDSLPTIAIWHCHIFLFGKTGTSGKTFVPLITVVIVARKCFLSQAFFFPSLEADKIRKGSLSHERETRNAWKEQVYIKHAQETLYLKFLMADIKFACSLPCSRHRYILAVIVNYLTPSDQLDWQLSIVKLSILHFEVGCCWENLWNGPLLCNIERVMGHST